jgi:hypothetical protein
MPAAMQTHHAGARRIDAGQGAARTDPDGRCRAAPRPVACDEQERG